MIYFFKDEEQKRRREEKNKRNKGVFLPKEEYSERAERG